MFTVGAFQENCYLVRRRRRRAGAAHRSRRRGRAPAGRDERAGRRARGDPAHPHPLRPHRRRRPDRARDRRAGLLPARGADRPRAARPLLPARCSAPSRAGRPSSRSTAASACSSRASTSRSSPRPATALATSPTSIDGALFSGDVLFQSSIGRTDLPGADHATLMASIAGAARALRRRHDGPSRSHGAHHARPRARDESLPAGARGPVSERPQAPRGTYDVLPEQAAARAGLEDAARRILEPAGYRRIETPTFEATELFARGVGESTDIVQKEMYTFQDAGGRSLTLRPEGTAPVVPRLPRARHAHAGPAGEALVPGQLLPPGEAAGRALPPVLADRAPRRSAPTIPPSTPSRSPCCTRCWASSTCAACACASARWAASTRAPSTASA